MAGLVIHNKHGDMDHENWVSKRPTILDMCNVHVNKNVQCDSIYTKWIWKKIFHSFAMYDNFKKSVINGGILYILYLPIIWWGKHVPMKKLISLFLGIYCGNKSTIWLVWVILNVFCNVWWQSGMYFICKKTPKFGHWPSFCSVVDQPWVSKPQTQGHTTMSHLFIYFFLCIRNMFYWQNNSIYLTTALKLPGGITPVIKYYTTDGEVVRVTSP